MNDSGSLKSRRALRLKGYDYSWPGAYFITVCTRGRQSILGEVRDGVMRLSPSGEVVQSCWEDLPSRYPGVRLDAFVIMPNHLHALIILSVGAIHELPETPGPAGRQTRHAQRRRMLLSKVIGYAKMSTAREINLLRGSAGAPVWQRSYHDRVVRDEESLNAFRQYIAANPSRWEEDEENPGRPGPHAYKRQLVGE